MTVRMREDDAFDAAGAAVDGRLQTVRDELENAVAVGQPAAVEQLETRRPEPLLGIVVLLLVWGLVVAARDLPTLDEIPPQHLQDVVADGCCEFILSDFEAQIAEAFWVRRDNDPKCPRRQAPQELEVALHERSEATDVGVRRDVEEHRTTTQIDSDGELLESHSSRIR